METYVLLEGTHCTVDRKIIKKGETFEGPAGLDERMPRRFVLKENYRPAPKPRTPKPPKRGVIRKTQKVKSRGERIDEPEG